MWKFFNNILCRCSGLGDIVKCSMSETYSSIDVFVDGEKYLLTIMKEEKKDDSV